MSELEKYISENNLNEIDVMNFLQDRGVVSDLAVTARHVFDDLEAVQYLKLAFFQ